MPIEIRPNPYGLRPLASGSARGFVARVGDDGAPPYVPGPAPHSDEWWISTDDVLDYANWLEPRVQEMFNDSAAWQSTPAGKQLAQQFANWWPGWSKFYRDLRENWSARIAAWETVRKYHGELLAFADAAKAQGFKVTIDPGAKPRNPEEKWTGPGSTLDSVGDLLTYALYGGLAVGGYLLVREIKK